MSTSAMTCIEGRVKPIPTIGVLRLLGDRGLQHLDDVPGLNFNWVFPVIGCASRLQVTPAYYPWDWRSDSSLYRNDEVATESAKVGPVETAVNVDPNAAAQSLAFAEE